MGRGPGGGGHGKWENQLSHSCRSSFSFASSYLSTWILRRYAMVLGVGRLRFWPPLGADKTRSKQRSGTVLIGGCTASLRCSYAAWSMHPASFRSAVQSAFAGMSGLCLIDVVLTAHCSLLVLRRDKKIIRVPAHCVRVYAWPRSGYRFSHGRPLPLWDV